MFFGKKKVENSLEIDKLKLEIENLKRNFEVLEDKFRSLKGLVYKRLGYDAVEPPNEEKKGLYMGVCLPSDNGIGQ